jgi:hypothetical protein
MLQSLLTMFALLQGFHFFLELFGHPLFIQYLCNTKTEKETKTIGYEDKAFIDLDGNHDDGGWMVTGKQEN